MPTVDLQRCEPTKATLSSTITSRQHRRSTCLKCLTALLTCRRLRAALVVERHPEISLTARAQSVISALRLASNQSREKMPAQRSLTDSSTSFQTLSSPRLSLRITCGSPPLLWAETSLQGKSVSQKSLHSLQLQPIRKPWVIEPH